MKFVVLVILMSIVVSGCGKDDNDDSSSSGSGASGNSSTVYAFQTNITLYQYDIASEASNFVNICSSAFNSYTPSISCSNFYPFLGRSSTNGFKNFIGTNSLDANASVKLLDGTTVIATTLQNLVDSGPAVKGSDTWSGWPDGYWYSGVASDGSAGNNCSEYTDATSSSNVSIGTNGSGFSWTIRAPVCDYYDDYRFICLCN